MLGRAVNAKHLRPGLPVPPSLPLGKRLRIFAFDPPQKTSFFGDPGQKRRKRRPLRATGTFRFADGFLLSALCLAEKILCFTWTLLKWLDYKCEVINIDKLREQAVIQQQIALNNRMLEMEKIPKHLHEHTYKILLDKLTKISTYSIIIDSNIINRSKMM